MPGRTLSVVVTAVALTVALTATSAARAEKPTIAVLPLRVQALQMNEVQRINAAMREVALRDFDVQSEADTTQLLEASQTLGLDCDVNAVACGQQLGEIANVQFLVVGQAVGGLDGQIGIDAFIIDIKTKGTRRASLLLPQDPARQGDAVRAFADVLYPKPDGTAALLVSLRVLVDPNGADVVVDGIARGTSPLDAVVDTLAPGDHHVLVSKKGYLPFRSRVNVKKGEAAELRVTLSVDPDAMRTAPTGLEAAAPWITAVAGGVVAVGGGVAALVGAGEYWAYEDAVAVIDGINSSGKDTLTDDDVREIATAYDAALEAKTNWDGWGQASVVAGLVAVGIGVLVVGGGAAWAVYQQGVSEAPASE